MAEKKATKKKTAAKKILGEPNPEIADGLKRCKKIFDAHFDGQSLDTILSKLKPLFEEANDALEAFVIGVIEGDTPEAKAKIEAMGGSSTAPEQVAYALAIIGRPILITQIPRLIKAGIRSLLKMG